MKKTIALATLIAAGTVGLFLLPKETPNVDKIEPQVAYELEEKINPTATNDLIVFDCNGKSYAQTWEGFQAYNKRNGLSDLQGWIKLQTEINNCK